MCCRSTSVPVRLHITAARPHSQRRAPCELDVDEMRLRAVASAAAQASVVPPLRPLLRRAHCQTRSRSSSRSAATPCPGLLVLRLQRVPRREPTSTLCRRSAGAVSRRAAGLRWPVRTVDVVEAHRWRLTASNGCGCQCLCLSRSSDDGRCSLSRSSLAQVLLWRGTRAWTAWEQGAWAEWRDRIT